MRGATSGGGVLRLHLQTSEGNSLLGLGRPDDVQQRAVSLVGFLPLGEAAFAPLAAVAEDVDLAERRVGRQSFRQVGAAFVADLVAFEREKAERLVHLERLSEHGGACIVESAIGKVQLHARIVNNNEIA